MNKFIFLLLFWTSVYCQEFKFDKMAVYQSKSEIQETLFCNSKDGDYVLKIGNDVFGTYAYLDDFKNKLSHRFIVNSIKQDNNEIRLVFNYEYSMRNTVVNFENYLEYEVISEDDTYIYGSIISYKNKRKKKLLSKFEIKVLKAKENYFYLSRYLFFHPFENNSNFNLNINGIIQEVTKVSIFKSGKEIDRTNYYKDKKLASFQEVDFNVTVPKSFYIKN